MGYFGPNETVLTISIVGRLEYKAREIRTNEASPVAQSETQAVDVSALSTSFAVGAAVTIAVGKHGGIGSHSII